MIPPLLILTLTVLAFGPIHVDAIGPLSQAAIGWLMHTCGAGSFAVLIWLGCRRWSLSRRSAHLMSIVGGLAAGVAVEWIQTKIPYRSGRLADLAPDALGIILAQLGIWFVFVRNRRRQSALRG